MNDIRLRRRSAGLALVAAPLLPLTAHVVVPPHATDTAGEVASQAAHVGAYTASTALGLLAVLLAVPALLGLAHPLRTVRPRLANGALAVALAGVVAQAALLGTGVVTLAAADGALDDAQSVALQDAFEGTALFGVLVLLLVLGSTLAPLALLVGLWRSGWSPLLPVAGLASLVLLLADAGKAALAVGFALTAVAWGAVGLRTLAMGDEEWAGTSAPAPVPV